MYLAPVSQQTKDNREKAKMEIKALTLLSPTDDGRGKDIDLPILIHFGPGIIIEPHKRYPERFSCIRIHGREIRVYGNWKDIAQKAGYVVDFEGRGAIDRSTPSPAPAKTEDKTGKKPARGGSADSEL